MFIRLNNKAVSKAVSSLLLVAILCNNIIFPSRAFALTAGPSQPEFSSFDSAGASDMVNLFTGDFNYNIPLMDVDGYPINIAYHASPGMDQEASWVGLGWNINSGAINRSVRGLPDDFNGEEIKREIKIEDFKAWGVGIGAGVEFVGNSGNFSLSGGMGVTKSNYKGVGLEFYFEPTMALAAGNKIQGSLTAGLGVKASTTDGVSVYPQLGVGGQYKTANTIASIGINMGANYNSREGLKSVSAGVGLSVARGKDFDKKRSSSDKNKGSNGMGMGFGSSASVPVSSQAFLPKASGDTKSQSYSLDFKLGTNACVTAPFGYVRGYYAQNGMVSTDINLPGYGYLNSPNVYPQSLQDFTREKDGMMYPETPNLPIANYSYDLFFASAQGMEMAFRPHRNDMGTVHDNATTESSFGLGVSGELLLMPDINVGVNASTQWSEGNAGRWDSENDMLNSAQFSFSANDYESAYFKVAGEKTTDDNAFLSTVMNDSPVAVELQKISDEDWKANNRLVNNAGTFQTVGANFRKNKRAVRNNLVSTLNASEAQYAAIDKTIYSYNPIVPNTFTGQNLANVLNRNNPTFPYGELLSSNYNFTSNRLAFSGNKKDHISEIMVTNPTGGRYVYGIPVYNRTQHEVTFNISGSAQTNLASNTNFGLISYAPGTDNSKSNSKGLDHFYERNIVPEYVHSYLLTEILSPDYVDRTGNGPSADDYGDYTKFNYSMMGSGTGSYQWRVPFDQNKAAFNSGFLSDKTDDKASYIYGTRDVWVPHSIETKNYIALFVLDPAQRSDGIGVSDENGGKTTGARQTNCLKEIRLYAKKNLSTSSPNGLTPIKVVHFEYDYSLCPGISNNNLTASTGVPVPGTGTPTNGKLTLKKIYFTYGNSNKGSLTPYLFTYCNGNYGSAADNPAYDPSSVDRWGYYQKNNGGNLNNLDFPYTVQDATSADANARAWSLTEIQTPAGSKINITYEADDYAYVQDKEAGQMFGISGMALNSAGAGVGSTLHGRDFMVVDLSASKADGVPVNAPNALSLLKEKYFKSLEKVYIKACVELRPGKYEFVPLYAGIESINISNNVSYSYGGNTYYNAIVKLSPVGINDDNSSTQINPIVKAAFQLGRMYLPGVIFPGSQNSGNAETIIKGLVTLITDVKALFIGINKALYNRGIAKTFVPARSVVRLCNPTGKKLGGGSRVKKIVINDNWNAMTGETASTYGQEYSYTTKRNGVDISSGVASYEPMHGGDENSNRAPVEFSINRPMAPNDEYFQEEPLGESFYPDPLVGYSKVTVKNLDRTAQNVRKHATGKTEYEFYTARDFPAYTERTDLQKQRVKPELIKSLLNFGSTDKLYMSQGFAIHTNDMHGKPRGEKHYEEGEHKTPYAGITYFYKTRAGTTNRLDNVVNTISPGNVVSSKTMGQTTDIINDARHAVNSIWGTGVSVNVSLGSCSYYVPLLFIWPSFSNEKREFNSISTTKVINQYGLVDYTVAFDNHSSVQTRNLLYDEENGEVVLTSTANDFDQPVYDLKYPAYWAYDRMGHAYKNIGLNLTANTVNYINTTGEVSGSYLVPGDEVLTRINPAGTYMSTWVVYDAVASRTYLVRSDGQKFINSGTSAANIDLKVIRSGRRNLQELPMASITSLQNPVNSTTNKLVVNSSTGVLSASAVEYSENWQTILGDTKVLQCSCNATDFYTAEKNFIMGLFLNAPFNTNIASTSPLSGYNSQVYPNANLNLQTLTNNYPFVTQFWNEIGMYGASFSVTKSWTMVGAVSPVLYDNLDIDFNVTGNPQPCGAGNNYRIVLRMPHNYNNPGALTNDWTKVVCITPNTYNLLSCCPSSIVNTRMGSMNNPPCGIIAFGLTTIPNVVINSVSEDLAAARFCGEKREECTNLPSTTVQCGKLVNEVVNPYIENLRGNWRPKKDYAYLIARNSANTNIATNGAYSNFKPFYDQQNTSAWLSVNNGARTWDNTINNNWMWISEAQLINQHGNALQMNDALDRRSASLYGYNNTLPVAAAANAYYNEIGFDGFEDYDYLYQECSALGANNTSGYIGHFNFYGDANRVVALGHTGRYAISVPVAASGSTPSKLSVTRKFTANPLSPVADNVPYTLKPIDNAGLFGPLAATARKYVLSVWAREVQGFILITSPQVNTYTGPSVNIKINGSPASITTTRRTAIINGWQKIEYEFNVPAMAAGTPMDIELVNASTQRVCLFDDLRIHPFNASMKTQVFDPQSLRLMAEHDDRNFSTIYEYDEEGTLVRVQKETEKGLYTVKETRSGLRK